MIILILSSVLLFGCSNKIIKNVCAETEQNQFSCTFGNEKRNFILYLPQTDDYSSTNLVLMFHGYGSNSVFFRNTTHFEKDALDRNCAVVYLTGIPRKDVTASSTGWNYSYTKEGKDEILYVKELIRYLKKEYGLGGKVFGVGFSNGAFFLNKIASQYPEIFSAVASVGGMMPDTVWNHCPKSTSVRYLQINGTKDDVVPMEWNNSVGNNPNPSMERVIDFYAKSPDVFYEKEVIELSKNSKLIKYGPKAWWILIDKYTHVWPTDRYCNYSINQQILDFFQQ